MKSPIQRHKLLQPLSRDHHHTLLLAWKIRQGLKKGVETDRMMKYARWFWHTYLQKHFEEEEKHFFPVLGNDNPMVKKALTDHRKISRLFTSDQPGEISTLRAIEAELDHHIRFEERQLFNAIQEAATREQWLALEQLHADHSPQETWEDEFWK